MHYKSYLEELFHILENLLDFQRISLFLFID